MGIFAVWREKCQIIRTLVNAQKTPWYAALFAALCVLGGVNDHTVYIPVLYVLTVFVLFSVLFTDDNKVFLVPLLMIFFSLGCDNGADAFVDSKGDMLSFINDGAFVQVMIICAVCVGSFLVRLIADGSIAAIFKRRRIFTISIIAMDIAFLTNGLFSDKYDIVNLGYGAFMAMGFTVVYFLVAGMIESSDDPITYGCQAMVATAYVAFIQIMTVVARLAIEGKFIIEYSNGEILMNKDCISLGWGVSTVVAAVFVLGIPAAMYLARSHKGSIFYFISSVLFVCGTIITNVRSAMLVSVAILVLCAIVCCINGKNRVPMRIYCASTVILFIAVLVYVNYNVTSMSFVLDKISDLLRFDLHIDSGRSVLWKDGLSDFRSSPIFGVGFNDGGYPVEVRRNNVFSNMYHCIFVELAGAMGTVGIVAFVTHIVSFAVFFFKKPCVNKMLLLLVPVMIIGMSLADNFFFYLHFQIFYGAFLALAEHSDPPDSDRKIQASH